MKQKIIYYEDELNDEFASDNIVPIKIDKNYEYTNSKLSYKIKTFFWYRIVALPIGVIFMKLKFSHKVVGKKKLKLAKKEGGFLFGNHTHNLADAVVPTKISIFKKVYVIVHANNVSIKYMKKITPKLGAIPLPDDLDATRNFNNCIKQRLDEKAFITIYPEAHIWPYYTKIRPFTEKSFRYPVIHGVKSYCFTNTYQKRKFFKTPKMITYIDGPFEVDENLGRKEAQLKLRNEIYNTMSNKASLSNIELITYKKKEGDKNE